MDTNKKALLAVIAGNVIFGFSFLFSKLALDITIPIVLVATRFLVAFAVLNLIVIIGRKRIQFSLKGKPLKYVLLLALFQPVIYFIAESYGILYTSSAFAGIIIAIIPLAGIILDVVIMRTKVTPKQILCAIASVLGVVITTIGAQNMTSSIKGIILLLIAVLSGALFYVFSKRSAEYYNPLERTYVMFGVGAVVYTVLAIIQCRENIGELIVTAYSAPVFWISILYLSVLSSVVAFLLLNFGSNYVSVSKATLFANSTTVISILAGVIVLHESFSWQQIIGAIVILLSVYFAR